MPRPASFSEQVGQRHSPACQYRESYALTTSLRPVVREFRRVFLYGVRFRRAAPTSFGQSNSARALIQCAGASSAWKYWFRPVGKRTDGNQPNRFGRNVTVHGI